MAELNLLQIVQEFCKRQGLQNPSIVTGAQDDTTQQILGLMNEGIQDIADRYNHQQLITRITFNSACATDGEGNNYQAIDFKDSTSLPGFKFYHDKTLWDATNRRRVAGPFSYDEWQYLMIFGISQAVYNHTLFNNALYIYPNPSPPSAVTFSLFYQSKYGVYDSVAGTYKELYTLDTDQPRLPSYLMLMDIKWRYQKQKGLPYAEDQRICEEALLNAVGRVPQGDLVLDPPDMAMGQVPTLYIAAGNTIPS